MRINKLKTVMWKWKTVPIVAILALTLGCTITSKSPREDDQAQIAELQAKLYAEEMKAQLAVEIEKAINARLAEERLRLYQEWQMIEGRRAHKPQ